MRRYLEIAGTGVMSLRLHLKRSLVTVTILVTVLLPYLVGLGISRAVRDEAEAALRQGADLYVTAERFGRAAPVPLVAGARIKDMPGVVEVVPRIIGRVTLGNEQMEAVLVGIWRDGLPGGLECIDGRLFAEDSRSELVVGSDLARRLNLKVGARIPPFYRSRQGERVSEVVGIFRSDVGIWQSRIIVTSFATAAHIFDQDGVATDFAIRALPGYEDQVRRAVLRDASPEKDVRLRVVGRDELTSILGSGPRRREGAFTMLFTLAFAGSVLAVTVTSGFGLAERRREVGILKATGWQTDELLLRSLTESFLLSLIGAAVAVVMAAVWLKVFNGRWIAGIFLAGVDAEAGFRVPFRLASAPVLLAFLVAFVVVMSGSLYSTWRAAITEPRHAMR